MKKAHQKPYLICHSSVFRHWVKFLHECANQDHLAKFQQYNYYSTNENLE